MSINRVVLQLPELTVGENDHNRCPQCGGFDIYVRTDTRKFVRCLDCNAVAGEPPKESRLEGNPPCFDLAG